MNLSQLYFGSILSATDPVILFNLINIFDFFRRAKNVIRRGNNGSNVRVAELSLKVSQKRYKSSETQAV